MHHLGGLPTPYATSDRCAIDLFPMLVEKGFRPALSRGVVDNWCMSICESGSGPRITIVSTSATIAGAVSDAVAQLIESI
jgi:hypothetical protein